MQEPVFRKRVCEPNALSTINLLMTMQGSAQLTELLSVYLSVLDIIGEGHDMTLLLLEVVSTALLEQAYILLDTAHTVVGDTNTNGEDENEEADKDVEGHWVLLIGVLHGALGNYSILAIAMPWRRV